MRDWVTCDINPRPHQQDGAGPCYNPRPWAPHAVEVRVTDPDTGGEKGTKLARTDLLPGDALLALAEHYGKGAGKYEDRNWERGYAWSLSYAALQRHLLAWWQGEDLDEDGNRHIAAVTWHALALLTFTLRNAGTDNRPKDTACSSERSLSTQPSSTPSTQPEHLDRWGAAPRPLLTTSPKSSSSS